MDLKQEGVDGFCMRDEDNEFLIQVEKTLSGEEHDRTILHELYHCLQHMMNIPRCEICSYMSEKLNLERFNKTLSK